MSCVAPDIELADKNIFEELGVSNVGNVRGYSFCPPKKCEPTKASTLLYKKFDRDCLDSGCSDNSELSNIIRRDAKGEYVQEEQKKALFLAVN